MIFMTIAEQKVRKLNRILNKEVDLFLDSFLGFLVSADIES
jgi:hypothetical protein